MDQHPATIGRYHIERLIGAGGMGVVYLARDPQIGRQLAIKVLRTNDEEYRRRFKIEVNAAGALRHPHIITIHDSGEHEGLPFLAMEYVPGETLADKIKRRAEIPLAQKLRYIEELCAGSRMRTRPASCSGRRARTRKRAMPISRPWAQPCIGLVSASRARRR